MVSFEARTAACVWPVKVGLEMRLPCANVTKLTFGGDELKTAFVTTARDGLSRQEVPVQPLAGGLFAFETGVPALPKARRAEK